MTEADLLGWVTQRCNELGLLWFHCEDSRRNTCSHGFPDLVIVGHSHGVLFRELKAEGGTVTTHQKAWGRAINAAGGNWAVWRPIDWEHGHIQRELRTLAECQHQMAA
jgi:hypothetical protein